MKFKDPTGVLIRLLLIFLIIAVILGFLGPELGLNLSHGEEWNGMYLETKYVLCQPNDYINIRAKASRKSKEEGYLMAGDAVEVSNRSRNGYAYSPSLHNELGEGWIFEGYLVNDQPINIGGCYYRINSNGRVAARKCIGGKRRCWLYNGDRVKVWYMTDEWCVTSKGFIMTKYLEEDP